MSLTHTVSGVFTLNCLFNKFGATGSVCLESVVKTNFFNGHHMKILLAVEPVDFRKGIDGMAALCRTVLKSDPFSGCLFVFLNRRRP